jgi:hypothetical protein
VNTAASVHSILTRRRVGQERILEVDRGRLGESKRDWADRVAHSAPGGQRHSSHNKPKGFLAGPGACMSPGRVGCPFAQRRKISYTAPWVLETT